MSWAYFFLYAFSSGCHHVLWRFSIGVFLGFTYCFLSCLRVLCSAPLPTSVHNCLAARRELVYSTWSTQTILFSHCFGHSLVFALSSLMKKLLSSGEYTKTILFNTLFITSLFSCHTEVSSEWVLKGNNKNY